VALRATKSNEDVPAMWGQGFCLAAGPRIPFRGESIRPARSWHFHRSRIQGNEHGAAVNARLHSADLRIRRWTPDTISKRDWKDLEVRPLYCNCFRAV
jgi:hypothetical protein